jgi:hypothetical protein
VKKISICSNSALLRSSHCLTTLTRNTSFIWHFGLPNEIIVQVVAIRDIIPPPQREVFNDVYIAYELMDTDLHQIIRSNQALSEEHCQVYIFKYATPFKLYLFITEFIKSYPWNHYKPFFSFAVFSVSNPSWVEVYTFCECSAQGLKTKQPSPKCQLRLKDV